MHGTALMQSMRRCFAPLRCPRLCAPLPPPSCWAPLPKMRTPSCPACAVATGRIWTVPPAVWLRNQLPQDFPPACEEPAAASRRCANTAARTHTHTPLCMPACGQGLSRGAWGCRSAPLPIPPPFLHACGVHGPPALRPRYDARGASMSHTSWTVASPPRLWVTDQAGAEGERCGTSAGYAVKAWRGWARHAWASVRRSSPSPPSACGTGSRGLYEGLYEGPV